VQALEKKPEAEKVDTASLQSELETTKVVCEKWKQRYHTKHRRFKLYLTDISLRSRSQPLEILLEIVQPKILRIFGCTISNRISNGSDGVEEFATSLC
jgi:hypothetical protein